MFLVFKENFMCKQKFIIADNIGECILFWLAFGDLVLWNENLVGLAEVKMSQIGMIEILIIATGNKTFRES